MLVQLLSHIQLFLNAWTAACQAFLYSIISKILLKFKFIESVMLSKHRILCYPLLLLPSIFHNTRVFSSESALCITWPKYWSFSFSISPSNEYSGLISIKMDWLLCPCSPKDSQESSPEHSKASILQHSAFLMVQLINLNQINIRVN